MLKIFKKMFKGSAELPPFFDGKSEFDEILKRIVKEVVENNSYIYPNSQVSFSKSLSYQEVKKFEPKKKVELLQYLSEKTILGSQRYYKKIKSQNYYSARADSEKEQFAVAQALFSLLMRSKLALSGDDILDLFALYIDVAQDKKINLHFANWPIGFTTNKLVKAIESEKPDEKFIQRVNDIIGSDSFSVGKHYYSGVDVEAAKSKITKALSPYSTEASSAIAYSAVESDNFGKHINSFLEGLNDDEKSLWSELFQHCTSSAGSKPKKIWLDNVNQIIDRISVTKYKTPLNDFLTVASKIETRSITETNTYNNRSYDYTYSFFMHEKNRNLLKGFVWSLVRFHDAKTIQKIAKVAERCFEKVPGVGPAAAGVGNAAIYVLAQSKGMEGIAHLSRLKLRIKQNNTQKLINNYIETQAKKLNLLPSQIEEIAAPDFKLVDGELNEAFDDYTLNLKIIGTGKTQLTWFKPDGSIQKTVPSFIKKNSKLSKKLNAIRNTVKQIKQSSTAQRDRIDRLYVEDRTWKYDEIVKNYIEHGLVSSIAKKLIWILIQEDGKEVPIFNYKNEWLDINDKKHTPNQDSKIKLWHPINSKSIDVLQWREKLESWQIQQPMKQAYREVYLLTDAEINTKSYSNRMAAHILKQHQFNALAGIRGWKYSLLGAYDDGRDGETASKHLSAHQLTAEFWIDEILDDNDSFNDAGIWNYVATDQVRFTKENDDVVDLIDVDKLVLSEVMRDVDLFVGVTSVGNDPQWQDNAGEPRHRTYWQSFSFGDLSEVAKTRKEVLEKLVPRLKIKDIAAVEGKFLVVKGTRHTYKIHIGSTNILRSPNDTYLCIVPSRGKDTKTENIFLPFEGDRGLSIILSKAFMLAEDDKITDKTILSQL